MTDPPGTPGVEIHDGRRMRHSAAGYCGGRPCPVVTTESKEAHEAVLVGGGESNRIRHMMSLSVVMLKREARGEGTGCAIFCRIILGGIQMPDEVDASGHYDRLPGNQESAGRRALLVVKRTGWG